MRPWVSYTFVCVTITLVVYGQIVIKWQVLRAGELPLDLAGRVAFVLGLLTNAWVVSALAAALVAAVSWMLALSKLPLSHAYPFVSVSFVLVLIMSGVAFSETMTWQKIAGVCLIMLGVVIGSQG
jgi:drug/metabolite transporter (DMT)-like permease